MSDDEERLCEECGESIAHRSPRSRYCGYYCSSFGAWHASRARKLGLPAERTPRYLVFSRDGWICWICERAILGRVGGNEADSPNVDHVIPLTYPNSPGHVWSNVRASHKGCNARKGNRLKAKQPPGGWSYGLKRETVKEMAAELGLGETANRLGISRSRVDQIVNGRRTK